MRRGGSYVSRLSTLASVFISALMLAACGSKPEASDISKHVESVFRCSPFTVSEVKKTNGAPAGDNQYSVAYSFQVEVKGGKQGAIELVTNLLKNRVAYEQARELKNLQPFDQRRPYEIRVAQLRNQMHELSWGGCKEEEVNQIDATVASLLEGIQTSVLKAIETSPSAVKVPYVLMYQGTATMLKTEAGWVVGSDARNQLVDALETEPSKFERPVPPPVVEPQGIAPSAQGANV